MIPAIKESKRRDKRQNQINIPSITYDEISIHIYL